jgi:modulator of FtsH protease
MTWAPFFGAIVTAAAALTGLLFVAVSINLSKILDQDDEGSGSLPGRAGETLGMLLVIVIGGALTLIPEPTRLLGAELLVAAGVLLAATLYSQLGWRLRHPGQPLWWTMSRMSCTGVASVPATLAGASLAAHWGGGLYWLAAAALLGTGGAILNAWVLLVEIIR